jgi:ferrous iron transport protein B
MSGRVRQVLVAGNPNAGKTTVFNLLTGARAKVGNYPGITVDKRTGKLQLPGGERVTVVDLPGTYSLTARSVEERVAVESVLAAGDDAPDAAILLADATTLRRGLYFVTQVIDTALPVVVGLTMMDEARSAGLEIDPAALERELGCPVVPMVANRGEGKRELVAALAKVLARRGEVAHAPSAALPEPVERAVARVEASVAEPDGPRTRGHRRARALWALLSLGDDELEGIDEALREAVREARREAAAAGVDLDEAIVAWRYERVDRLLAGATRSPKAPSRSLSSRLDDVLVHPVWGMVVFVAVMAVVFQSLFSWSEPAIGLFEDGIAAAKSAARSALGEGALSDLVSDGVIAGVGNVIVFVPQIALLFVFITFLEDSGYLARVAFVIDRLMGGVGLHGRAFVPMLSGFACAIPAVMATRTIESRRDRLLTMLVVPLMSCSARLPVYVLVTATVFDPEAVLFGPFSVGAAVLLAMYLASVAFALGAAAVLRRTVLKGSRPALVLELPPYRRPSLRNILVATWSRTRRFLVDAGTVILALTVLLWALLTYPKDPGLDARFEPLRQEAALVEDEALRADRLASIEAAKAGAQLRASAAGRLGSVIEPAIEPLGFDWRLGIGILGAFAAREVFVSTLGVVFDVGEATEESQGLRRALREAKRADGSALMTPLTGVALMVFFVLACQCMSTIAVVRRESGSWKWPLLMFGYMSALAYLVTLLVYQGGRALGLD